MSKCSISISIVKYISISIAQTVHFYRNTSCRNVDCSNGSFARQCRILRSTVSTIWASTEYPTCAAAFKHEQDLQNVITFVLLVPQVCDESTCWPWPLTPCTWCLYQGCHQRSQNWATASRRSNSRKMASGWRGFTGEVFWTNISDNVALEVILGDSCGHGGGQQRKRN